MKSKRIQWLDFGKGILILFVVLSHFLDRSSIPFKIISYLSFIFIMPSFFAISGYLYKPVEGLKDYCILLYKKINGFIIPYIVFTILLLLMHAVSNHQSLISNLSRLLYHLCISPIGYLWFLYSLFFIFIIVGIFGLIHLNLCVQISISFILLILSEYLPWQESIRHNINPIAGIGEYMFCFYIGYVIKKFQQNIFTFLNEFKYYLILLWLLLVAVQMYFTNLNGNMDMFNYSDILTKLLSVPIMFLIFSNFHHNWLFNYFDKYGKYTLLIYLVHLPIIMIVSKLIVKSFAINNPFIQFVVYFIPSWYISIFVCYLSSRFNIINFVFYPKKYINNFVNREINNK